MENNNDLLNDVIDLSSSPEANNDFIQVNGRNNNNINNSEEILILDDDDNNDYPFFGVDLTGMERYDGKTDNMNTTATTARKRQHRGWEDYNTDKKQLKSDNNNDISFVDITSSTFESQSFQQQLTPELQVLEVFPDADEGQVRSLLQQYNNNPSNVLSHMAERGYNKVENQKISNNSRSNTSTANGIIHMTDNPKYDYMSTESFEPSALYIEQANHYIQSQFPYMRIAGIKAIMKKYQNHYAIVHDKIINALKGNGGNEVQQYQKIKHALDTGKLDTQQIQNIEKLVLVPNNNNNNTKNTTPIIKKQKRKSTSRKVFLTEAILLDEVNYVKSKMNEWFQNIENTIQREKRKDIAQQSGTAMECSCCYDSYDITDMISCKDEGHLFCIDCLNGYVTNLIFGQGNLGIDNKTKQPALELLCFHNDGCTSGFNNTLLEKALSNKIFFKKYEEIQFQLSIERAGLTTTVVTCPKCNYQVDVPIEQKILYCPVAECRYESCRECGEASHIPLRCNEVEKERETKGRLVVEEAISEALIRKCPKCKKGFIKSDGCNKITCGCGAKICYLCQKLIKDYSHFCQTPHCTHKQNCSKCPLYTKAEEDDARAMREAGMAAAEKVRNESAATFKNNGNGNSDEVNIDVDRILAAK